MKILVAEDEHDILLQYELTLKGNGHSVMATSDGEKCPKVYMEETLKGATFDVVLLDTGCPRWTG